MPYIPITAADCEDISDLSSAAGADGHPVNPSAPNSDLAEVLLISSEDNRDLFSQVEQIIATNRLECVKFVNVMFVLSF